MSKPSDRVFISSIDTDDLRCRSIRLVRVLARFIVSFESRAFLVACRDVFDFGQCFEKGDEIRTIFNIFFVIQCRDDDVARILSPRSVNGALNKTDKYAGDYDEIEERENHHEDYQTRRPATRLTHLPQRKIPTDAYV